MIIENYNKVKKIRKPKHLNQIMWAAFAPDGHIQFRSLSYTKSKAKDRMPSGMVDKITWKDYEERDFSIRKVNVKIRVVN